MLFRLSEDYRAALDEDQGARTYRVWLDTLSLYASTHFKAEERCMHHYRCPAAGANRSAHDAFVARLTEFASLHAAVGFRPSDALALVNFLDDWLADHIGGIDTQLKSCVVAGGDHGV